MVLVYTTRFVVAFGDDILYVIMCPCIRTCPVHILGDANLSDQSRRNKPFVNLEMFRQHLRRLLMLSGLIEHFGDDLLVCHPRKILQISRHFDGNLCHLGWIVLRIVSDNILEQSQQNLDSMPDKMVVCLLVNVASLEYIRLGAISIEQTSRFPRVPALKHRSRCLVHDFP